MSKEIFIKNLEKIGTKLSDFEEVPDGNRHLEFTILGKGNFGYVEKMKSKKNNSYYAIKKLDKNRIDITDFHRETEILFTLKHDNIVKFYGYFEDKENITKYKKIYHDNQNINEEKTDKTIYCLVLEYVLKGSLNDYLIKLKDKLKTTPISQSFIIKIFGQLLDVLVYLYDRSVMHRDIKPDNILLDENSNVKVTDFGLSALYKDKNPENVGKANYLFGECTQCGRYDFICPEIEKGQQYDYGSDIFSLGLTMLWLISTEKPIKMIQNKNSEKPERKIYYNFINPYYNKYLKDLIINMTNESPLMRPGADQAYNQLVQIEKMIYGENKILKRISTYQKSNNLQTTPNSKNENHYPYKKYNSDKKIISNLNGPISPANSIISNFKSDEISIVLNNPKNNISINTSLIRVLQLLCRCIKENIKSKLQGYITNSLSLDLFNILEITAQKIANQINKETFSQNIINFRKKFSSKSQLFKEEKEISPKLVFDELFRITIEDFRINNIIWNSNLLNGVVESVYLPRISFPHIYEKIELIKKEYKNPFFDYFYYISIGFTQCPYCNLAFQPKAHCYYFIPLPAKVKDKISNLIINYFNTPKKVELKCDRCSNNKSITYKFFTTPKYLLIFLDGTEKKEKILDEYIDLTPYCYTNIGPKKYHLYGFIKESAATNQYKSIIKNENENNWIFFSGIDDIAKTGFNYNIFYLPNIAIYKGLD